MLKPGTGGVCSTVFTIHVLIIFKCAISKYQNIKLKRTLFHSLTMETRTLNAVPIFGRYSRSG